VHIAKASGLEGYTCGQLNFSRAIGNAANLTELRVAHRGDGVAESGSVKGVEHVATDFEEPGFAEMEALEDANVLRLLRGAPDVVQVARSGAQSRDHAISRCRWRAEGGGIQVLYAGPAGDIGTMGGKGDCRRLAGYHIAAHGAVEEIPAGIDTRADA